MKQISKAFTLVEVLVIVAIITVLVMAAITFFAPQSKKARDAKRKTDLYAIAKVLEEYETDYSAYPAALTACGITTLGSILDDYITSIPCDPRTHANYIYEVGPSVTSRTWFRVYSQLDNTGDDDIVQVGCSAGCGPGGTYNYYVASANAPLIATAGIFPTLFPTPTGGLPPTSTPSPTTGGATSTPTTTLSPTPTLTPTPTPAVNLLTNPGFEGGISPWVGISAGASIVTTQFHTGASSLQIAQPLSSTKSVRQTVSVIAGQNYAISGWMKTGLSNGSAQMYIAWRDSGGNWITTTIFATVTGTTNWTLYSTNFTAPAGAVSVYFQNIVNSGPGGNVWFDDLVFQ